MKIGICFGSYWPLYQGELDLIIKSKKQNDLTFVFICGYDGDSQGANIGLSQIKRYRIIKDFLEDDLVKVEYINNTELGLDQSMSPSPSNWKIWINAVGDVIFKNYIDYASSVTWYVTEPFYKNMIEQNCLWQEEIYDFKVDLINRFLNPISGTDC